MNNALKKYDDMKKKNKKLEKLEQHIKDFSLFIKQCYSIVRRVKSQNL